VLGIAIGTAMAFREDTSLDAMLEESHRKAEDLIPQGQPVEPPADLNASIDLYEPDPRALAGIPPYPGAEPRALVAGNTPQVQGADMSVAWFQTDDSVEAVVSFYEQAFADAQRVYVAHRESERLGYAGFVNPSTSGKITRAILHLVTAVQHGDHTLVFVSTSVPGQLLENQGNLPPGVAFPPGASQTQSINLSELGQARQTVYAHVENTTALATVGWYERRLADQGWKVVDKDLENSEQQLSLTGRQGDKTQVVMVKAAGNGVDVVISFEDKAAPESPPPEVMQ